ncbi:hypothetical protein BC829DRAFT_245054 [Chytridium lagenaria]|nr:hypothetical protein BC829DRAFT_245054 [Chytridium lagenaria]
MVPFIPVVFFTLKAALARRCLLKKLYCVMAKVVEAPKAVLFETVEDYTSKIGLWMPAEDQADAAIRRLSQHDKWALLKTSTPGLGSPAQSNSSLSDEVCRDRVRGRKRSSLTQ